MDKLKAVFDGLCLKRFCNAWLFVLVGFASALLTVLASFARHSWHFDLLVNFIPQYALGLLVCISALLLYRRWLWATALCPFLVLCLVYIVPLYVSAYGGSEAKSDLKVYKLLAFNVLSSNSQLDAMLGFIESEDPDFIVMTEFTGKWDAASKRLSKRYKLQILEAHTDNFGIAIFGRFDGESHLMRTNDEFGLPTHYADFALPDGRKFRLVGTHAIIPVSSILLDERNKCLLQCAKICRESASPSILAGDFNMTPFSPFYGDILREGDLVSASKGRGLCFTWPSWSFPMLKPMAIQIDNCLTSKGIDVISWRRGPDLGSDHLPVIVEFALK